MNRPALLSLDQALPQLLAHALPLPGVQMASTFEADGRVLAQDVTSALQVPPQDNSSMDGYAVRAADCLQAGASLHVTQRIPAGSHGTPLGAGEAARIFTGAPIPEGADAVVMQEDCEAVEPSQVKVLKPVPKGLHPISRKDLVEAMVADRVPARFQLQMHKFIWPSDERGV
jgi:molybdopterin molybdotransferase